jgi:hypothetical protein
LEDQGGNLVSDYNKEIEQLEEEEFKTKEKA